MRNIDSFGLKMCSYQANLFESAIARTPCSSKVFIRRFMNSNLAKRMDTTGFLFESSTMADAFDELEEQYGTKGYGIEKFSSEEMHWIGYIYRYWAYVHEKTSKQVYKIVKPEQLRKLYYPYHSLDPQQAIDRIKEEMDPSRCFDVSDIARGVAILRKIRSKARK